MSSTLRALCVVTFGAFYCCCGGIAPPAWAQDAVAQFYRGRTISFIVGSTAGGGYDAFGRLVARYIGKYIPGAPSTVVSNMPGAASLVLANHIYNVAPQDGTQVALIYPGAIVEPLLGDKFRTKFDPLKFSYLGNANTDTFLCIVRNDAPVQKFEDVFTHELILGASAEGGPTADEPALVRSILGAKYNIIKGYPGTAEILLALQKGEVQGTCVAYSTVAVQYPEMMKTGVSSFGRILVQDDVIGVPDLNAAGVPLSVNFAKTPEDRAALELTFGQNQFLRPFVLGPDVPPDRLAALRTAFAAAMRDPDLIADARKLNPVGTWSTGEDLAALVKHLYATPAGVVDRVRKALGRDQ